MRAFRPLLCALISLQLPAQLPSGLTAPSSAMRRCRGAGFQAMLPANWGIRINRGLTSCAAPDGLRVTAQAEGGTMVTVMLGMTAAVLDRRVHTVPEAGDQVVGVLVGDNPQQRVFDRRPSRLGSRAADSFQLEGPSARGGRERSWVVATRAGNHVFFVALTSPVQDFEGLKPCFGRILASLQVAD